MRIELSREYGAAFVACEAQLTFCKPLFLASAAGGNVRNACHGGKFEGALVPNPIELFDDPHFAYRRQREEWRRLSAATLLADSDSVQVEVLALLEDMLAGIGLALSGSQWGAVSNGRYLCGLLVSFIRTQFIALDLVVSSELIEASTLLRKQLELMARIHEVSLSKDAATLHKVTPNVRHVQSNMRGLYGLYSEVAHSSHPDHFELMGSGEGNNAAFTSLYPKYSRNTLIALQHHALLGLEFALWAEGFVKANKIADLDPKLLGMVGRVGMLLESLVPEMD